MSQQATREIQMKRHTRVGLRVTLIGAIVLAASLVFVIVLIIVAYATTPPALLPMPEPVPEDPGRTASAQQLDDAVELDVRSQDLPRVLPLLDRLTEQQGGHRLNLQDTYGVDHYALPADTAQWLAGIDVSNGKEAYAALSDPPATDPAQPLTTVDAPWMQRKVFANLYLVAAAVALIVSAAGIGIVVSNET